jgi:hypothetical protein
MLSLTGCVSSKSGLIGTWRAETTVVEKQTFGNDRVFAIVFNLSLPGKGDATFQHFVNSEKIDEAIGEWKKADDYLVVRRANGGFAAFRITSISRDRIAIVTRDGSVYQFNRIQ